MIANKHRRFGYRRAHALLRRAGHQVKHKKVCRLWRAGGLAVRKRTKKKPCHLPQQERIYEATYPHQVWCVDFVADQTMSGAKLRILTVTDEWTRRSLTVEVGRSLTAAKGVAVLQAAIASAGGAPAFLRMDNGPEFVALALWHLLCAVFAIEVARKRLTLRRESRGRMALPKVSTASFGMSF